MLLVWCLLCARYELDGCVCHHCRAARELSLLFFFLMIRRPPRSTLDRSSAASDVYKRQGEGHVRSKGMAETAEAA